MSINIPLCRCTRRSEILSTLDGQALSSLSSSFICELTLRWVRLRSHPLSVSSCKLILNREIGAFLSPWNPNFVLLLMVGETPRYDGQRLLSRKLVVFLFLLLIETNNTVPHQLSTWLKQHNFLITSYLIGSSATKHCRYSGLLDI